MLHPLYTAQADVTSAIQERATRTPMFSRIDVVFCIRAGVGTPCGTCLFQLYGRVKTPTLLLRVTRVGALKKDGLLRSHLKKGIFHETES